MLSRLFAENVTAVTDMQRKLWLYSFWSESKDRLHNDSFDPKPQAPRSER